MTLLLHSSRDLPDPGSYRFWFPTTGTQAALDVERKLPRLAARLEGAFTECRTLWWRLGCEMGAAKTGDIAIAPTGGSMGSDFGVMLAWSRLGEEMAAGDETCLAVCDDPWLFRHMAGIPGVRAGRPPLLWAPRLRLRLRGMLARCKLSLSVALAALRLGRLRHNHARGDPVLLVYGHPLSDDQGFDAYFADLMQKLPKLKRLLHTDCPAGRALELIGDGRTASLHAWGSPLRALGLVTVLWKPERRHTEGPNGWLVRRAADNENGGGGPAMTRWQLHCQERWLEDVMPGRVAWPWENFAWERGLCRAARRHDVKTIGYQHTVIGPHQINYSTATNPDGLESIPDLVVANGPAYRAELVAWGVPEDRLLIGGALRFPRFKQNTYDPEGPVFVPLSGSLAVARQQLSAARAIAETGRRILVKEHPMYPLDFEETQTLKRTDVPLARQSGLSAVLYSTGTSGLEAMLAGLPSLRLMPEDRIATNILPANVEAPAADLASVPRVIEHLVKPEPLAWDRVFAPVDSALWREILNGNGPLKPDRLKSAGPSTK